MALARAEIVYGDCYGLRAFPLGSISNVLDVGANIGFFSMSARFIHPASKIVAIEPHSETFSILIKNTKWLEIKLNNSALGSGQEVALLQEKRRNLANQYDVDGTHGKKLPSRRLHEFVEMEQLSEKLFVKVDCEGAERHFIDDPKTIELLGTCVGVGMELHATVVGGLSVTAWRQWFAKHFSSTHQILFWSSCKRGAQVRMFKNGVPLLFDPAGPLQRFAA